MKFLLLLIFLVLLPVSLRSVVQLHEKWDDTPEFSSVQPYPLATWDEKQGKQIDHVGPYHAQERLSYAVDRVSTRTVTAITARRLVRIDAVPGGIVRTPIFTYVTQPGTPIERNPPDPTSPTGVREITGYPSVELPDAKTMPPGKGYVLETSIQFPAHGDHDARTYTAQTRPFDVE